MSSSHFGKKQTTLLIATVFYKDSTILEGEDNDPKLVKKYYDFVSEYLGHNNVFYMKCMTILLDQLKEDVPFEFKKLYNVTDGGSHFVSRYAYWDLGKTSRSYSKTGNFPSSQIPFSTEIVIHQITCPPQHGKGECDGHGAVIKKKARLFLLVGKDGFSYFLFLFLHHCQTHLPPLADHHINNPQELSDFIEQHTQDSCGKVVTMKRQELENATNANAIPKIKSVRLVTTWT